MQTSDYEEPQDREALIAELITEDPLRMKALKLVAELNLPDCFIAAGFLRNLIWDHLHGYAQPTPLNDVDVIYFDFQNLSEEKEMEYEARLTERLTGVKWQVRNQARMHLRNGDAPYTSSVHAMGYWPEKETAVAVRLTEENRVECISAFGLESLFRLELNFNNRRDREVFRQRVQTKRWLEQWPKLRMRER